ncbi:hypothetical protein [Micromonospora sp. NPDC005299]|uniref:hypothetical protein n=1 Tax=Micromonospora sp. NPDC005299 TaxID=3364231 RepID=UPI0036C287A2
MTRPEDYAPCPDIAPTTFPHLLHRVAELANHSQDSNRKVHDVAEALVAAIETDR